MCKLATTSKGTNCGTLCVAAIFVVVVVVVVVTVINVPFINDDTVCDLFLDCRHLYVAVVAAAGDVDQCC